MKWEYKEEHPFEKPTENIVMKETRFWNDDFRRWYFSSRYNAERSEIF